MGLLSVQDELIQYLKGTNREYEIENGVNISIYGDFFVPVFMRYLPDNLTIFGDLYIDKHCELLKIPNNLTLRTLHIESSKIQDLNGMCITGSANIGYPANNIVMGTGVCIGRTLFATTCQNININGWVYIGRYMFVNDNPKVPLNEMRSTCISGYVNKTDSGVIIFS